MKMDINLGKLAPLLFLVTGVVWVASVATGSGLLLFWPALGGFVCAGLLYAKPNERLLKPLSAATAFFGLALALFQLYYSASLAASPIGIVALYSFALFVVMMVIYLALIYNALGAKPAKAA